MNANIKRFVLAILGKRAVSEALDRPLFLLRRVLEKTATLVGKVHRNLPRVAELAASRNETPVQIATKYYHELGEIVGQLTFQPKISVLVPVYKVREDYFREALASVLNQVYDNWELCLVDDASGRDDLTRIMEDLRKQYPEKVKIAVHPRNQHISVTSNTCLDLATGDYVALLDHDDRLYPNALAEMVRYLNKYGGTERPEILYSDECTTDGSGDKLTAIYRKPDWSPLMHLCMNYTTHLSVYKKSLLQQIGGFRAGFEGAQDHDLMLRAVEASTRPVVHVPFNLYQWRAHPESTANARDAKPYAAIAGEKAVSEALLRRGWQGSVAFDPKTLHYRVKFTVSREPLVSIVIPSRDSVELLDKCLKSVVSKSTYRNYEIIIADNGSVRSETTALYSRYQDKLGNRFNVIKNIRPFNFGAQVNDGVEAAAGEFVVLLNNDTEVLSGDWLEEMLGLAQLAKVGAVGCKLLLANGRIQHAGVVLSTEKIAEHVGFLCNDFDNVYWNVLNTVHETMAVSAACLMVAKDKYLAVGGLDQTLLSRSYGDIEFCLSLKDKGYETVYTPHARLLHHEQQSRGRSIEYFERFLMLERRGQYLATDAYLNPRFKRSAQFQADEFYGDLDLSGDDFRHFLSTQS